MKILTWINVVFGILAVSYGVFMLRGVLRGTLRPNLPTRFLEFSLIASVAGLLPLTHNFQPIHLACMLSVYCAAAAIAAWLKFHLSGFWRPLFAFFVTAVLYLDIESGSLQFLTNPRLVSMNVSPTSPVFHFIQFCLAAVFAVLGFLAIRRWHPEPNRAVSRRALRKPL